MTPEDALAALSRLHVEVGSTATELLVRLINRLRVKRVFFPEVHCEKVVRCVRAQTKATLVFVPLLPDSWSWDVSAVKWSKGLAVQTHLFGQQAHNPPFVPGLIVVEDCAHSARGHNPASHYQLFSMGREKPLDWGGGGLLFSRFGLPPRTLKPVWPEYHRRLPQTHLGTTHVLVFDSPKAQQARQALWAADFDTWFGISGFTPEARKRLRRTVVVPAKATWSSKQHEARMEVLARCL